MTIAGARSRTERHFQCAFISLRCRGSSGTWTAGPFIPFPGQWWFVNPNRNRTLRGTAVFGSRYGLFGRPIPLLPPVDSLTLDSYPEIFKQGDFNIDIGAVRRLPTTRQFVGWLCRRGGMRFRAGSVGGVLGLARGGSGCWRVVRTDVCGKIETAARPGHLLG